MYELCSWKSGARRSSWAHMTHRECPCREAFAVSCKPIVVESEASCCERAEDEAEWRREVSGSGGDAGAGRRLRRICLAGQRARRCEWLIRYRRPLAGARRRGAGQSTAAGGRRLVSREAALLWLGALPRRQRRALLLARSGGGACCRWAQRCKPAQLRPCGRAVAACRAGSCAEEQVCIRLAPSG